MLIQHFTLKITQKITICIRESISIPRIKRFGNKSVFLVLIYKSVEAELIKSYLAAVIERSQCCLTLILPRSRTGTVWFYTSTSNKRAA